MARLEMALRGSWLTLEVSVVLAMVVLGSLFQYWLSGVVPYDASEFAVLSDASVHTSEARINFIRFNAISLLLFYLVVRRSVGVVAAITLLLALQTSVEFQEWALRIRWPSLGILVLMLALVLLRHKLPPWRVSRRVDMVLSLVCLLLTARGLYHCVTFPARIEAIRQETTGNAEMLHASLLACGGGDVTPLEELRECPLTWPAQRSLEQQEALLLHTQVLSPAAAVFDGRRPVPEHVNQHVAIFDHSAVAFFVVTEGEREAMVRRVVRWTH